VEKVLLQWARSLLSAGTLCFWSLPGIYAAGWGLCGKFSSLLA